MVARCSRAARADRAQATTATSQARQQGAYGGRYARPPAGGARHAGRRTGAFPNRPPLRRSVVGQGHTVELAWADQGYTGKKAREAAQEHDITLQIVKLPEAKKGFVLLPRRWVVERSVGWLARFRRLSRDYERLPEVLSGLHFLVFAVLMLPNAALLLASVNSS